jgi:chromosome segregation and condensation protein ScpB
MVRPLPSFDRDLAALPPEQRWRTWLRRIEAVLFTSSEPVPAQVLSSVIGGDANLAMLITDLEIELEARPYEVVFAAGGYVLRTREDVAAAVRHAKATSFTDLTRAEAVVLMTIAYYQPVTRSEIGWIIGKKISGREVDSELLTKLRRLGLIDMGPRSGDPGSPPMYVTTPAFLTSTYYESLQALPDWEKLEAGGHLDKAKLIAERKIIAQSMRTEESLGEPNGEEEPPEPLYG